MELRAVDHNQISPWRENYKKQLGCPVIPDHHEALFQLGQAHIIEEVGQSLGYAITNHEQPLLLAPPVISELYFSVYQSRYIRELIVALIEKCEPATIISRTDEKIIFPMLMDMQLPNQVLTAIYYLDQKPHWLADPELVIMPNQMEDAEDLLPYYACVKPEYGGIPDQLSLTKSLAAWTHYRLTRNGEILGICYVVPQGGPYVSVFTIIKEGTRGQGFGKYLTTYTVREAINHQQIVIAAVDIEQVAAKNLIESLGGQLSSHVVIFKPHRLIA